MLISAMRERGVREGLVDRVEEILRETKCRIKIGSAMGERFLDGKRSEARVSTQPYLFNLIIADIEEYMERRKWGGVKLKEEKIYTLMYADDNVVLAEDEYGIKVLISRLEAYLDKKGLELNVEKIKIMRFRKGGGEEKEDRLEMEG